MFLNLLGAAKGALIRAAALIRAFGFFSKREMSLKSLSRNVIPSLLLAFVLCPVSAATQVRTLKPRDKTLIIQSILRRYDFTHSETWHDNGENTVYLLAENISAADVPVIKGIKFTIIEPDQIDRLKTTGFEYYRFSRLEIGKTAVQVSFIRTYASPREANGSVMEYTCRKVSGRWKLKARLDGVFAS